MVYFYLLQPHWGLSTGIISPFLIRKKSESVMAYFYLQEPTLELLLYLFGETIPLTKTSYCLS